MIKRLIGFALDQPLFVILGLFVFIGAGVIAFNNLPVEAFPDVTDTQVRAAVRQKGAALREPSRDRVRRHGQRAEPGPAGEERILDVTVVRPQHPVGTTLHDRVAEMLEALDRSTRGGGETSGISLNTLRNSWPTR